MNHAKAVELETLARKITGFDMRLMGIADSFELNAARAYLDCLPFFIDAVGQDSRLAAWERTCRAFEEDGGSLDGCQVDELIAMLKEVLSEGIERE